jgi:hypothetical protein
MGHGQFHSYLPRTIKEHLAIRRAAKDASNIQNCPIKVSTKTDVEDKLLLRIGDFARVIWLDLMFKN